MVTWIETEFPEEATKQKPKTKEIRGWDESCPSLSAPCFRWPAEPLSNHGKEEIKQKWMPDNLPWIGDNNGSCSHETHKVNCGEWRYIFPQVVSLGLRPHIKPTVSPIKECFSLVCCHVPGQCTQVLPLTPQTGTHLPAPSGLRQTANPLCSQHQEVITGQWIFKSQSNFPNLIVWFYTLLHNNLIKNK